MKNWIKNNRFEFIALVLILVLALFLRVFRIDEFLTFLGDEGRDVRIVRDLITKGNLVFIGPQTSIGNMYLGPLYYYLIAPSLAVFNLNPVGPALFVALLGTLTVFLTYFFGKQWFGAVSGLISAFLFAISPVAIIYSRSSWNPNPMPLFALLAVVFMAKIKETNKLHYLIYSAISLAFALQMHYLGLLLIPVLFVIYLQNYWSLKQTKGQIARYFKYTAFAFLAFFLLMSPLLLFDLKHNGQNFNAIKTFFTNRETTVNLNPAKSDRFIPVIITTVTDLITARQSIAPAIISILLLLSGVLVYIKSKWKRGLWIIAIWLTVGLLGLGVYKQHVYVHYLGFIYPAVYLFMGALIGFFATRVGIFFKLTAIGILIFLSYINLSHSPVFQNPNRQLQRTESVADLIIEKSAGKSFNFGLIAKQNYDESYRYFLENKKALMVRGEEGITDQLFVICEDGDQCQPEGHPQWQIAIFGPSKVQNVWQVDHIKIYQLIHRQ